MIRSALLSVAVTAGAIASLAFAGTAAADGGQADGPLDVPLTRPAEPAAPAPEALPSVEPVAALTSSSDEQPALAVSPDVATPILDTAGTLLTAAVEPVLSSASGLAETVLDLAPPAGEALRPVSEVAEPVLDNVDHVLAPVSRPSPVSSTAPTAAELPSSPDAAPGPLSSPAGPIVIPELVADTGPAPVSIVPPRVESAEPPPAPHRPEGERLLAATDAREQPATAAQRSSSAVLDDVERSPAPLLGQGNSRVPIPDSPGASACIAALAMLGAFALIARPRANETGPPPSRACLPAVPPG